MMSLTAFTFIFLLGGVSGAALMLLAVARSESWRAQQRDQAASKLERVRLHWHSLWLTEARRADKAEAKLAVIHEQHVAAGKERHRKDRARIMAKCAEMRAELQKSTVVPIKDAT